jgi:P4 family phage/plasmid primase-like protien
VPTRKFIASQPGLFTLYGMKFDYDPEATIEGTRWFKFLGELFPDDAESVSRLQEIMGYLISGRTGMEKLFLLLGVKRAGKGTIGRVLEAMHSAAVGTSVRALTSGNFTMEPLLDKKIVVVGDARAGADPRKLSELVEDLLMISGGDHVSVARKNKTNINDKPLGANFLIMSNEMPILYEASGALAERFEVIQFEHTFAGNPDIHLKDELVGERAAIFNWAMDGLERFDRQGERFTRSARSEDMREDIRQAGSPKVRFAADELEFTSDGWETTQDIFLAWRIWADQHGEQVGTDVHFSRDMKTVFVGQWGRRTQRTGPTGKQLWGRAGVTLRGRAGANH